MTEYACRGCIRQAWSSCTGVEHFLLCRIFTVMDREREEWAIHEKLARCRQLAKQYISEPTATHLRELEAELLVRLRRLEEQVRPAKPRPPDGAPTPGRADLPRGV